MLQNILDNFKFVRRYKGGVWLKTKERGWLDSATYNTYLGYGFDPIKLKEEVW